MRTAPAASDSQPRPARAAIAIMRAVPGLFTGSLAVLGAASVAAGRTGAGLAFLAAAAGAAIFGLRIALAVRFSTTGGGEPM